MVASGLEGDGVYVKPTRLSLHFIFALGLLAELCVLVCAAAECG